MRYHWQILDAGPLALDGGGMFGVVPKVLWEKVAPPDERNRITLTHNCLLLKPEDGGPPVLIETGSGDKFDAKMKAIFGLGERSIVTALTEAGQNATAIATVVATHLHFDHAGGLTRLPLDSETPDWTAGDESTCLTFPNAKVVVQRQEWEDAVANRSVMTRTYLPSHLDPIREQLELVDTPLPSDAELPTTEVRPGIEVFRVPGHTWGQQAVKFADTDGRTVVFVPDVIPTVHHVGDAYSMSYDVEPYTNMLTRKRLLADALERDWTLVLDHEPNTPVVKVTKDDRGKYQLVPQEKDSA
ncbi:MAG: MBL fold metallo-hydrolase [Planctomycetota bacterium]